MTTSFGLRLSGAIGALLLATTLAACGTIPIGQATTGTRQSSSPGWGGRDDSTPSPQPVTLTSNVPDGKAKVAVDTLVSVAASSGTVTAVQLTYKGTDAEGAAFKGKVKGSINAEGTRWTAAERLDPGATYTLAMTGQSTAGDPTTQSSRFTTANLTLAQQTFPELYPLEGSKVGVGMPVVLRFDVAVKDRAAFEKNLKVTTVPKQAGSWRWFSDREVRYRPKTYWKPGTKVKVKANLNGVNAGGGIYGQRSTSTDFTVGRSMIIKIDLATDVARVIRDGKQVRRILVSGGKPGWETRSGTKLIMGSEYKKKMTNEMIGAEEDYDLTVDYAMRITNSGEFIHSAPWNAANFGRRNASHGCVGMSTGDAGWLINQVLVGDPVVTTGTKRGVEDGNGYSDWNMSFDTYKKGSAL